MTPPTRFIIGRTEWLKNNHARGPRLPVHRGAGRSSPAARMVGNVRGVPQIVFKVVRHGGCQGVNGLAAQMDYILGKADHIIDPAKRIDRLDTLPKEYARALAEDWAEGWNRKVGSGHSMHLVASFPRGTDPEAVADIVRAACHDLLDQGRSRFTYVAAVHRDTHQPHAHILVDRRNAEGEFFYFARDHEFTYDAFKDRIVEHAAEHGIELVNSSRLSRGLTDSAEPPAREALRGLSGTLVGFGRAPYRDKPNERQSYFVTVQTADGAKTLWGKELGGAIEAAGARIGAPVRIVHQGKERVSVATTDGQRIAAHRNRWAVETPGSERAGGEPPSAPAGDDPKRPPSSEETRSADWKRQQILGHAQTYRDLADALGRDYPGLSQGFAAAAHALERGRALTREFIDTVRGERMMPDDQQMKEESDRLSRTIAQARDDLMAVRDRMDDLPAAERPGIEAQYFDAVRDLQEIERGYPDRDYIEPAHGTIYEKELRDRLQSLDRDQLSRALGGTGIDPDEMAARLSVQSDNAALEAHWVEADAAAIASARGYDMDTAEGRREAFRDVVDTYGSLRDRTLGLERDARPMDAATSIIEQTNRETVKSNDELKITVVTGDGQQIDLTEAEIRNQAGTDPEMRLVDPAEKNIAALREWQDQKRREAEIDYDAASEPDLLGTQAENAYNADARDLVSATEARQALIDEAKTLTSRETPTTEQQRRLTEIVDQVLGREAAQELKAGNTDVLREFGGRAERIDLAETYLRAEQSRGADRTAALEAVGKDRDLHDMDKQAVREQALDRQDDLVRQRARDEGLER